MQQSYDVIIDAGLIVTMNPQREILENHSILIQGNRINDIVHIDDAKHFQAQKRIDAKTQMVIPGLINAHCHASMTLFRGLADDRQLMDWLQNFIWPIEQSLAQKDFVYGGALLGCFEMLRGGTTTYVDMYFHENEVARATKDAGMRAILAQTVIDFPMSDTPDGWQQGLHHVRTLADQWQDDPLITPAIGPHSPYTCSPEHLQDAYTLSKELSIPLTIHVAEPETETEQIRTNYQKDYPTPVQYLEALGVLDEHVIAAHMIWTDPEKDFAILKHRKVGIAHCPHSNTKLASGIAKIPLMKDFGIRLALGTDGAASNNDLSIWDEMDLCAKLHKLDMKDATVMPAEEVFEMATIGGALAIGKAEEIGSIEVGKKADIVWIDRTEFRQMPSYNPYSQLVYATQSSDVSGVMVDGAIRVEGGRVQNQLIKENITQVKNLSHKISTFLATP